MKQLLCLLLASLALVAGALTHTEVVTTPLGLTIKPRSVPSDFCAHAFDGDDGRYYYKTAFCHGNTCVRLYVDNPTGVDQPLKIKMPITRNRRSGYSKYINYATSVTIPPGQGNAVDLVIPHIGDFSCSAESRWWEFVDASGKIARNENLIGFHFAQKMPRDCFFEDRFDLNSCPRYVAVSKSFSGFKNFGEKYEKTVRGFLGLNSDHEYFSLNVNVPDFEALTDWRVLACYDAFIFTQADWEATSERFRNLMDDYLAVGGKLYFAEDLDGIDLAKFITDMLDAGKKLRGYGSRFAYKSDGDAMVYVKNLKLKTPFGSIVLVLGLFAIIAGPGLIFILSKLNRRIHLLWVFPVVAIVFSVAVALVIVFANGVSPKIEEFSCEVEVPELARKVIVKNTVCISPFTMRDAMKCPADALVTFDAGCNEACGDNIYLTTDGFEFVGNWAPPLWPVRMRSVQVVRTGKEAAK